MALIIWSGCVLRQPLQIRFNGEVGHFEYREPDSGSEGIMVAVPRGRVDADALEFAQAMRDVLGAGLVVAYDFENQRIPVDLPLEHNSPISWPSVDSQRPDSVYPNFQTLLQPPSGPSLKFYIGVRMADDSRPMPRIEVAAGGMTFEQLAAMEKVYLKLRDRLSANSGLSPIEIALNPRQEISWKSVGLKNHGVLLLAERGLVLRLPKVLSTPRYLSVYSKILASWVREASAIASRNMKDLPAVQIQRLRFGRIDTIASRMDLTGVVIAAPHGSFDWYTSELVEEVSYRTRLPAVVVRGFTPSECGGWRINVNQPTERRYPNDTIERTTDRSREVYEKYTQSVFTAARGPLNLYIEVHQNGTQDAIEVATRGVSVRQAEAIKSTYKTIRDRLLLEAPDVAAVNLLIEPVDEVAIGAWAAKDHGILRLAQRSLHFELPAQRVFSRDRTRMVYTKILSELVRYLARSRDNMIEAKLTSPLFSALSD